MATKTIVQNNRTPSAESIQKLSSISLMLEYDIDNTLNTIKENGHLMKEINSIHKCLPKLEINNNDKLSQSPPSPSPALPTNARKRWKILAKVLRKDSEETVSSEDEERTASVRRFKSFDLLKQDSFDDHIALNCLGKPDNWYKYKVLIGPVEYSVNIHHIDRHLTANDLMGFNNTGNICVWPSEEALTVYVLSDLERYRGKWILELGGGMTCLTGLMLSKYSKPFAVHLTDGNSVSVDNVRKTVCLNELSSYTKCSVLKWEDDSVRATNEYEKFDCILSADCLFFDEARSALVNTIWFYLSPDGEALVMAPQRGKTLTLFVEECIRAGFNCDVVHRYNDIIWQRHLELQGTDLYDENIHYPVLIKLTKPAVTDYWKSNEKKYCDFCKCWISDNKASVAFHESGKRHKANVAKRITDISRSSEKSEKERQKMDMEIRKMEEAALKSYAMDIHSKGDMTARSVSTFMSAASSSHQSGGSRSVRKPGQIDPMRLPGSSDDENESLRPTVSKISEAEAVPNASLWVEGKSPDGYTYYWNVKTNESVWTEPKEGYLSLDEYNKINQIAEAQQEIQMEEQAKEFQKNAPEEVAKYNRERMKMYRRTDPKEEKAKEEKRQTFKTEVEAQTPEIGLWQTVEKKEEEKPVNWELPIQNNYYVPPVVSEIPYEPPIKRFKEKTIERLDPSLAQGVPATFIKRKFAAKGNARQRVADD